MKALIKVILYKPLYNLFILLVAISPSHNLAMAIIVLTALVRLALMPLKYKSLESQMKQRELQPEIKKIQEQHKGDKQAQSMATMQLYKDKGINPASGCLPMVIQLTVLIVLFYVFGGNHGQGLGQPQFDMLYSFVHWPESINFSFLWLKDITKPDPTYVLPVLAGISQYFFTSSMMSSMPQSDNPNDMAQIMTKQMKYFGPVMTILIAYRLPAALSLYWVSGTLIDWWQQVYGMKRFQAAPAAKKVTVSVRNRKEKGTAK